MSGRGEDRCLEHDWMDPDRVAERAKEGRKRVTVKGRITDAGLAAALNSTLDVIDERLDALEVTAPHSAGSAGWVNISDAAAIIGRKRASVVRYIRRGHIPPWVAETGEGCWTKFSGWYYYFREDWLREHAEELTSMYPARGGWPKRDVGA